MKKEMLTITNAADTVSAMSLREISRGRANAPSYSSSPPLPTERFTASISSISGCGNRFRKNPADGISIRTRKQIAIIVLSAIVAEDIVPAETPSAFPTPVKFTAPPMYVAVNTPASFASSGIYCRKIPYPIMAPQAVPTDPIRKIPRIRPESRPTLRMSHFIRSIGIDSGTT